MEHFPACGLRGTLLLLLMAAPALAAFSQSSASVRLEPTAEVRSLAGAEEPLPLETFVRTALIFSGVQRGQLEAEAAEIQAHIEELHRALAGPDGKPEGPREQAEAALEFMHRKLLRGYDEKQTRLDTLLASGSYNCVSSGILYTILLKSLGLHVWGVRTSDHAFCRVQAGGQAFDVETTSPFGFDPGSRKEFTDSFGRVTGFSYVPPSNYRDRRDIGERELLGLILFNRTAFASEHRDYRRAVPPAVDAYALLQDQESYERLITSLLNLASWYGMSRDFRQAVDFLDRARRSYDNERLDALRVDLVHNWALSLIQEGSFEEAQRLVDGQAEEGGLSEQEWKELTVYLYQVRAERSARGSYLAAARLIQEGLAKVGSDRDLSKSYEVYIHNTVVTLVRAGSYQEALLVLEEALSLLPSSAVLQNDRSMVLEAAASREAGG